MPKTHICYNNHTGAHVARVPMFHAEARDQIEVNSINAHDSNHNGSTDLKQPTNCNLKDCRFCRHHLIPSKIFLIAVLVIATRFSSCSCVSYYSLTAGEEEFSVSNDHDFSVMAVSGSDNACRLTAESSDDHLRDKISVLGFENNSPLIAWLGMDWEMLAPLFSAKFGSYFTNKFEAHNQLLTSAGTGMILHPSNYNNNQQRCTLLSKNTNQQFKNQQCSKLDSTLLSQCSPTDRDQDTSSVCPLQNSKYLHLYIRYTISTMKGLLLSDDIIAIITHQKVLQIRPKYFPLVFWLMVIGLTFSYFHIISGTSYDISHRDIQQSQSEINSQSTTGSMDSDSTLSYHTAFNDNNIVAQTFLPSNFRNHGAHIVHPLNMTNESESDLELFPAPIAAFSTTNHDHEESPTYTETCARVVINPLLVNQPFLFIHQFGVIPSPDSPILMEYYPPPIQETQQSKSLWHDQPAS